MISKHFQKRMPVIIFLFYVTLVKENSNDTNDKKKNVSQIKYLLCGRNYAKVLHKLSHAPGRKILILICQTKTVVHKEDK